jgi:hypothetical protein
MMTRAYWPLVRNLNLLRHGCSPAKFVCASVAISGALAASAFLLAAGMDPKFDTSSLVREVVDNELKAQKEDRSLWQYREIKSQDGKTQLLEVIETKQGNLQRVLAVNSHPLASEPEKNEEARIERLVSDREAFLKEHRKAQQDFEEEVRLLRMVDEAFLYQDAGKDGGFRKLDFRPNPAFHSPNREGEVFHHMDGSIWLDAAHKRLARISGRLTSEVKFGWGVLGHLDKGGTFVVEQREVGPGHWELTRLDVNMNGKALFFKTVEVKQMVENYDFRPLPPEITLQQAAQLLTRGRAESAIGVDSAERHYSALPQSER